MFKLLRQKNYALLWFSQLVSQTGNWALFAALPFFIFQITGSVLATGTMFIVEVVPPILLGSVAGVFVDRWDRRWTMIGANIVRGLLLLLLLAFRSAEFVWVVYVVAFFVSVANLFFGPANNALLPQIVKEEDLVTANSLDALGENVARIIGPAVGGALLAALGLTAVALIDVGAYLIGSLLIFFISVSSADITRAQEADQSMSTRLVAFWEEWVAGLRLVLKKRPLSYAFLTVGIFIVADSIMSTLLVVFVKDIVGVGASEFGWILTARGAGGVMGGLIVARVGPSFKPKNLMAFGMMGTGAVLFFMLQFPVLSVVLAGAVVVGFPVMAFMIAGQTWLQTNSQDEYRGRVFGAFETYAALSGLLGIGFATLTGESIGVLFSLYVAAFLFIAAGVVAFVILQERFLHVGLKKDNVRD